MNLKRKFVGVLVLALCMLTIGSSLTANAGETEEQSVRSVLMKYEDAAKKYDVDSMVQLSFDLSWPNQEQFKRSLTKLNDKVFKFETIALEKVEKDLYKATVLAETESLKETQMEIPVLNLNGQWKVIVGQDLEDNQQERASSSAIKSAEFYKNYFTRPHIDPGGNIQAKGNVRYYSFSFSYVDYINVDPWENTNSTPTIKGYQEPNGGNFC
ncbi:hypothetical protein [Paenibacillus sp. GCM10027626]|uniref:hypothetical protein n=1 Tax=Paenibacillus sp. GCM10027626 TaxID=3273411 RepID=UPI00362ECF72